MATGISKVSPVDIAHALKGIDFRHQDVIWLSMQSRTRQVPIRFGLCSICLIRNTEIWPMS
jgi:hypothetical protein